MTHLAGMEVLRAEIERAARRAGAPEGFSAELERPGNPEHGDYSSNAALVLARPLRRAPRAIAEQIVEGLDRARAGVTSVEIAGPGFLNFRLEDDILWESLRDALLAGPAWGRSEASGARRVNVEFVSANPTGPLHVAHGRGAAIGDAVAELLTWTGHDVVREFYVNDAGRQIELLGMSVEARFQQALGHDVDLPEGGYLGTYVEELVERIVGEQGREQLQALDAEVRVAEFARLASEHLRIEQERDLLDFGVRMDRFFDESSLFHNDAVTSLLASLEASGYAYEADGATWLRTSDFGDEKDRVLVKSDGSHTYFVSDIAYHLDKHRRAFDLAIDVWGADHHGHVARMHGALEAAGLDRDFLEVLIIQLVKVMRGGTEVRMSKRAGQFVTLRELFDETGSDVARYFFLMRRAEVPMTFDLDLALDTSDANPVYKVQYAHARMCSIFEKARLSSSDVEVADVDFSALDHEAERAVAKALLRLPERIEAASRERSPHLVCTYLEEVAGLVNAWYHLGNVDPALRVLAEGPSREARLALAAAIRLTLQQGLSVLGLSAPERMERAQEAADEECDGDEGDAA